MLDYGKWWYREVKHIELSAKKKKKKKDKVNQCLSSDETGSLMSMALDWSW